MMLTDTPQLAADTTRDDQTRSARGGRPYDPPQLMFVGDAHDVVLGPPGGGFDGPYGITEPQFEFEEDGSC